MKKILGGIRKFYMDKKHYLPMLISFALQLPLLVLTYFYGMIPNIDGGLNGFGEFAMKIGYISVYCILFAADIIVLTAIAYFSDKKQFVKVTKISLLVLSALAILYLYSNVQANYFVSSYHNLVPVFGIAALMIPGLMFLGFQIGHRELARGMSHMGALLFPLVLYVCVEWMCFGELNSTLKFFFGSHFYLMFYITALLTALFWVLNMIWKRYWISSLVLSVVGIALAYANNIKLLMRSEPLLPTELMMAGNAGDLIGFAKTSMSISKQLVFVTVILLFFTFVFFWGKGKADIKWWSRPVIAVLCALFVFVTVMFPSIKDYIFLADSIVMSRQFIPTTIYSKHGFFGGFLINIEGFTTPPEGYSEGFVKDTIKNKTADAADFEKPDVIVYLGESMFDIYKEGTALDMQFTEDPLKNIHAIEQNSICGEMVQASGVGGGTVRSEFEVLTGINLVDMKEGLIPYQTYVPKSQEQVYGLPNYFKEMGYKTVGIHSYKEAFYSRNICYGKMGFDEFIGMESMPNAVRGDSAKEYILDTYFVDQVTAQLEEDPDQSKFIFAISMENHGTFTGKYDEYDTIVTHENWDEKETAIANNYCKGLKGADEAMGELYEYVMSREKPTVVLYFGDHLPTLNDRHTVLESIGYISTGWSEDWTVEDRYNMYRTPFFIFSNYIDTTNEDVGVYSSYMLPSLMLEYMNAPTNSYWDMMLKLHEEVPVYNRYITMDKDGNLYHSTDIEDNLSKEALDLIREHTLISYDALPGKRYINDILLSEK